MLASSCYPAGPYNDPGIMERVNSIAKKINADIDRLTKMGPFGARSSLQSEIMKGFFSASELGPSALEAVKHIVAREQSDFIDMRDLLETLQPLRRRQLLTLFRYIGAPCRHYQTIVISDLDCTAIEKSAIAEPVYLDGSVIMGFVPLANALTHQGATTLTFVSARPKFIENWSIQSIAGQFKAAGLRAFSFEAGRLPGTALFTAAQAAFKMGAINRARELLLASATEFANLKFKSYLQLSEIFPHARFVFLGDDGQGDFLFAEMLVCHSQRNFAFIRDIARPEMKVVPDLPEYLRNRVIHHRTYFEAIFRAPPDLLSETQRQSALEATVYEYYSKCASGGYTSRALERDNPWLSRALVMTSGTVSPLDGIYTSEPPGPSSTFGGINCSVRACDKAGGALSLDARIRDATLGAIYLAPRSAQTTEPTSGLKMRFLQHILSFRRSHRSKMA